MRSVGYHDPMGLVKGDVWIVSTSIEEPGMPLAPANFEARMRDQVMKDEVSFLRPSDADIVAKLYRDSLAAGEK